MLASQRNNLIARAGAIAAEFNPVTLLFPGHPEFQAARRTPSSALTLKEGGFAKSAPATFLVLLDRLPLGVTLAEQMDFKADGVAYRIETLAPETNEPHRTFTANFADR